jgi:hypothetical protein
MDFHRLAQERSLLAHRELADKMKMDPSLVDHAKATLARWIEQDRLHPEYAARWSLLLDGPVDRLREIMASDTEDAKDLRQCSPFAGALGARERWMLWKTAKAAA